MGALDACSAMPRVISLPGRQSLLCLVLALTLGLGPLLAAANTDKVIFTGPASVPIPLPSPSVADLNLLVLTPADPSVRTNLSRIFPEDPRNPDTGKSTWVLLDDLAPEQRYELRVCWAATQPTGFTMHVYELDTVWQTPELIRSLSEYSYARQLEELQTHDTSSSASRGTRGASLMLLHIRAAAEYFTHDAALMKDPPPVLVDLILDPYMYNLFPSSLLPTTGYLVLVGTVTWFIARFAATRLQSIASTSPNESGIKKNI